jgi:hypothetical protein
MFSVSMHTITNTQWRFGMSINQNSLLNEVSPSLLDTPMPTRMSGQEPDCKN